jgi:2'-5' RNA ligase
MPAPGYELYFIAIIPPSPLREEAQGLKEYFKDHYNSKASLNSPPHITLHMPFQWKAKKEGELIQELTSFAQTQPPVSIALRNFHWFEPRVVYIQVEENTALLTMQQALTRFCKVNLNLFNAQYRDLPYHPHLTLAFRDLKKDAFYRAQEEFKGKTFQAVFIATEITLLKHDGEHWKEFRQLSFRSKS